MPGLPRSILADAGPIIAIHRAGDAHHARALAFWRGYTGKLITTWPVLAEAAHFLNRTGRSELLARVVDGALVVPNLSVADADRMRALAARYETMDLADASLVAVGECMAVYDVITVDRRDFAIYRSRTGRAFTNHFPLAT